MKSAEDNKRNHRLFILFNVIVWIVFFLLNFLFATPNLQYGISYALLTLTIPASMFLMYYSNYAWLVPKWFVRKRYRPFFAVNIVLTAVLCLIIHVAISTVMQHKHEMGVPRQTPAPSALLQTAFVLRDILTIVLSCGAAVLVKLSLMWNEADRRQRQTEVEKAETELRLLSNQIRPHFLLNTLNNIYALIAIDGEKAQKAVMSLSHLLRNMLYTDGSARINISEEVKLLKSYINLMTIRQQRNVSIESHFEVEPTSDIYVAPHIFITLVENAFKHGVSATKESRISISLKATAERIEFCTENSNYPKTKSDKSGHGIGLKQVKRLLENSYPGKYEWTSQTNEDINTYISKIILYDTKMCNH